MLTMTKSEYIPVALAYLFKSLYSNTPYESDVVVGFDLPPDIETPDTKSFRILATNSTTSNKTTNSSNSSNITN